MFSFVKYTPKKHAVIRLKRVSQKKCPFKKVANSIPRYYFYSQKIIAKNNILLFLILYTFYKKLSNDWYT